MPVGESHHFKGRLREPEKEVDEYEGRGQHQQHDDEGYGKQE
jgi:hypothetical protein